MTAPEQPVRFAASDDPSDRRVRELLRQVPPPALSPSARARLLSRLDERPAPWRLFGGPLLLRSAAALAVVALLGLLALRLSPSRPQVAPEAALAANEVRVGDEALLETTPQTVFHVVHQEATEVWLDAGLVVAEVAHHDPARPFSVVTAQARVVVVGTRFRVEASPGLTTVAVERGRVRVESRGAAVLLGPGERWSSASAGAPPPVPSSSPGPATSLPRLPTALPQRRPTVRPAAPSAVPDSAELADEEARLSRGRAALYERGDAPAALGELDACDAAHPRGALVRERLLLRLAAEVRAARRADAVRTANAFLATFPDDPRAADARRTRESLCRAPLEGCPAGGSP